MSANETEATFDLRDLTRCVDHLQTLKSGTNAHLIDKVQLKIRAAGGEIVYLRSEIERLRAMDAMRIESVGHLRCKHCDDNDFIPEHPPGACAECDLWR